MKRYMIDRLIATVCGARLIQQRGCTMHSKYWPMSWHWRVYNLWHVKLGV